MPKPEPYGPKTLENDNVRSFSSFQMVTGTECSGKGPGEHPL